MLGFIRGEELELHTLSTHMVYVQTYAPSKVTLIKRLYCDKTMGY
ncbi:MAG: hypothetical protein ACJAYO_001101 [Thalassolituus oleivorans]|jgi:hypothetical protein